MFSCIRLSLLFLTHALQIDHCARYDPSQNGVCLSCEDGFLPDSTVSISSCVEYTGRVSACTLALNSTTCIGCRSGLLPNSRGNVTACINYTGGVLRCGYATDNSTCDGCTESSMFLPAHGCISKRTISIVSLVLPCGLCICGLFIGAIIFRRNSVLFLYGTAFQACQFPAHRLGN